MQLPPVVQLKPGFEKRDIWTALGLNGGLGACVNTRYRFGGDPRLYSREVLGCN
jgi:hypothetical protein